MSLFRCAAEARDEMPQPHGSLSFTLKLYCIFHHIYQQTHHTSQQQQPLQYPASVAGSMSTLVALVMHLGLAPSAKVTLSSNNDHNSTLPQRPVA